MRTVHDVVEWLRAESRAALQAAMDATDAGDPRLASRHIIAAQALQDAAGAIDALAEAAPDGRQDPGGDAMATTKARVVREEAPAYGADYIAQLDRRLKQAGVSRGRLSRASGISMPQLSRWFNTDMRPTLTNVERLEAAFAAIQAGEA